MHHRYPKFIFDFLVFIHSGCSSFHDGIASFLYHLLLLSQKAFVGYFDADFIRETFLFLIFGAKAINVNLIGLSFVVIVFQDRLLTDLKSI